MPAIDRSPEPAPIDRRALIRDSVRLSSSIGAVLCAIVAIAGAPDLAVGIGIGTVLGAVNFVLLARGVGGAIDRTVAGVERTRLELDTQASNRAGEGVEPKDVLGRPLGAGGGFRLALLVLSIAGLILMSPVDPAGLAIGIVVALLGASVAAFRHNRAR